MTAVEFVQANEEGIRKIIANDVGTLSTDLLWEKIKECYMSKYKAQKDENATLLQFRVECEAFIKLCNSVNDVKKNIESAIEKKNSDDLYDVDTVLSIDKYKLDEEAVSQPGNFYRFSEMLVEAKQRVNELDDYYKLIFAEKNVDVREELTRKKARITEALVHSLIEKNGDVQEAKRQLREAQTVAGRLQAAVTALDHKRDMIKHLVTLVSVDYFQGRISGDAEKVKGLKRDAVSREIKDSLKASLN